MDSYGNGGVAVGSVISGRFRIDDILGVGGMGVVVAATHVELGYRVAIKFMRDDLVARPDIVERFLREARAVVRLGTEHVCKVLDVARLDSGAPYIVMEYLQGSDLAHAVLRQPLPVSIAVDYMLQACIALAEAHHAGIIHRDLKPANMFVTRRPDGGPLVKVLDFGIAKGLFETNAALTRTRMMMGSPGYMSPEQMESAKDVDARTDIWAIGVSLYQLLSGRLPFAGRNATEIAIQIGSALPAPIDVDPALQAIVFRCLEKRPDARYPDVVSLAADLAAFGGPAGRHTATMVAQAASQPAPSSLVMPAPIPMTGMHAPVGPTPPRTPGPYAQMPGAPMQGSTAITNAPIGPNPIGGVGPTPGSSTVSTYAPPAPHPMTGTYAPPPVAANPMTGAHESVPVAPNPMTGTHPSAAVPTPRAPGPYSAPPGAPNPITSTPPAPMQGSTVSPHAPMPVAPNPMAAAIAPSPPAGRKRSMAWYLVPAAVVSASVVVIAIVASGHHAASPGDASIATTAAANDATTTSTTNHASTTSDATTAVVSNDDARDAGVVVVSPRGDAATESVPSDAPSDDIDDGGVVASTGDGGTGTPSITLPIDLTKLPKMPGMPNAQQLQQGLQMAASYCKQFLDGKSPIALPPEALFGCACMIRDSARAQAIIDKAPANKQAGMRSSCKQFGVTLK